MTEHPTRPATRPARSGVIRGLGIVGVLVLWLAIASFGGPSIGKLSSVQSNSAEAFLPTSAESARAAELAKGFTQGDALPAFVVFTTPEGSSATADQLASWQAWATALPGIAVDRDGTSLGTVGDYLAGPPPALIPSQDGVAGLVVVPLSSSKANDRAGDAEPPLDAVIEALRTGAEAAAAGGEAHVAGSAGLIADLGAAFAGIDGLLLLVALGAVLVILFLVYRAVALPFAVLLTSVFGLSMAGGIVYLLASADVLTLNGQSQGILFILTVGAATDYGLLLVSRFREELEHTDSVPTAMSRAWRACLEPIAASAGTVIIGLLCLLLSDLSSNKSLGPVGAIGIASAFVAALTLLPALLLTGRWLFWPRIPKRAAVAADPGHDPDDAELAAAHGIWARVARLVGRHPRRIWVITAAVLAAACIAVPTFKASGTAETDVFLTDVDSIAGTDALAAHFPGGSGNPILVIAPEGSADAVITALGAVPDLVGPATVTTVTGTQTPLVVDGRVELQVTASTEIGTAAGEDTVRAVRAAVHALPAGGEILVGGNAAVQLDTLETSQHDLRIIIPAILLAVLLVLILLLRALIAPLLLLLATLLSFGTAMGISALVFNHLFDFPGADPAVPLFAFVFLVALGVDYSIFLMTRAREEVALHGPRDGVLRSLTVTGGVITSAGVVLAATFAALSVIPILFLAQIAFIVAFGVLLDTLVVRTLLVPALAVDAGRFAWWPIPPKPRSHQRR
ncbi:MMPL family transporter [Nakamurella sp. YIM 132087]|uniref:MMPL family transporter n=1 Tax=Nakamurella alba TaxID=2665158 RepID=A0A7K1FR60_9ACTN|nr:MMPL family transporter [Nakamurella alba]MTD15284.1 MMPL family transporter [Nakamurella alba]